MKNNVRKTYITILCLTFIPMFFMSKMVFDFYFEGKKVAAVPLPSFEDLDKVEGEFKRFYKKVDTTYNSGGASILLQSGKRYYLGEAIYKILHETSFEENAELNDKITLWVSYMEEASLDGEVPVIYQIELKDKRYLSFEQTYNETLRIRNGRAKLNVPALILFNSAFLIFFLVNIIRYKRTGKIPKWALKEIKSLDKVE